MANPTSQQLQQMFNQDLLRDLLYREPQQYLRSHSLLSKILDQEPPPFEVTLVQPYEDDGISNVVWQKMTWRPDPDPWNPQRYRK